jgi:hypothetical protein
MTGQREARGTPGVPGWLSRGWAWLVHASNGPVSMLVFIGFGSAAFGFGFYPIDLADRNTARDLVANGQWVVAADPFVHVVHHEGKGGNYFDVDEVWVRLPGIQGTVVLVLVDGPDMSDATEGWQRPARSTGYAAPLQVRYRVQEDGTVTAMARSDLDYWTISNTDPEFGLALGSGGLALAVLSLAVNRAYANRLERRRKIRRTARRAALGLGGPGTAKPG